MKPIIKLCLLFLCLWSLLLVLWQPGKQPSGFGFDAQNLNLWAYSANLGMLPFRDVFYPYGLLAYFQQVSVPLRIIFLALPALYLSVIYGSLRKILGGRFGVNLAFLLFLIFVIRITGFDTFTRYGGAFALGLLAITSLRTWSHGIWLGIGTGLLFTGLFDQGIYAAILIGVVWGMKLVEKRRDIRRVLTWMLRFMIGGLIGILPFVWFISQHSLWPQFVAFLAYLRDVSVFGKTPFTPFATSPDNLFTFAIIFLAATWIAFHYIYKHERMALLDRALVVTTLFLILLEQKSFIRSMDRQLTFLGIVAYLFFGFSFVSRLRQIWQPVGLTVLFLVIFGLSWLTHPVGGGGQAQVYPYEAVIAELKQDPDFQGKLFSFPGDPVFYSHLGQKPPFYFTAYEATPKYAQERQIEYLKENRICFVVINQDIPAIQDGVPNEIRNQILVEYLNSKYAFARSVGTFMILKSRLGCEQ